MPSLCILACDQVEGVNLLIDSVCRVLDVEVVIGDNSTTEEARREMQELADVYYRVEDLSLWNHGFGVVKTMIAQRAASSLVMIGDPDEAWEITAKPSYTRSVYKTRLIQDGECVAEHGRVFVRRDWRLLGMIHEELYHRKTRESWHEHVDVKPFADVFHAPAQEAPEWYRERKRILYEHLLDTAYRSPDLSMGTRLYWTREYWPSVLAQGWEPTSFDKWREYRG